MRSVLEDALFQLTLALKELNIGYAIIGAIGCGIYGLPRTTYDIDIILDIEKIKIPLFLDELERRGFSFEREHILEEMKNGYLTEVYYKNVRIDIFLPILPYFNQVIERAVASVLLGNEIKFASPEDLIILKLLANRERDKEDVDRIKKVQEKLNITYIKDSLNKLVGKSHPSFIGFQEIFEEG